jgi:hypothetical protein
MSAGFGWCPGQRPSESTLPLEARVSELRLRLRLRLRLLASSRLPTQSRIDQIRWTPLFSPAVTSENTGLCASILLRQLCGMADALRQL